MLRSSSATHGWGPMTVACTRAAPAPPPTDMRSELSVALEYAPIDAGRHNASDWEEAAAARKDMIEDMRMEENLRRSGVRRSNVRI